MKTDYLPHEQTTTGRERKQSSTEKEEESIQERKSAKGKKHVFSMALPPIGDFLNCRPQLMTGHKVSPSAYTALLKLKSRD